MARRGGVSDLSDRADVAVGASWKRVVLLDGFDSSAPIQSRDIGVLVRVSPFDSRRSARGDQLASRLVDDRQDPFEFAVHVAHD